MAAMAMARRPLPWLKLRQWWVGEVEEVVVELWVRRSGWLCGGGSERARRRCDSDGAVLGLLWPVKERQREGERARVSEHGGFASLFSPYWPD